MWVRSAFWVGRPKAGQEKAFQARMDGALVPALGALPGVRSARALWPRVLEDGPPAIACQILVEFDTRADVDRMLASPERAALRPQVLEVKAMFEGSFSHIDYEVGSS
ncbi:hypothetical protein [Pelomonas sp. KK5]|uniref:hypothetical protein n=1 Tax=Pelomonas sp. KK5 TaxID=1855730 RepID=UPI00097C2435|nr:hypothetical protein [Pelomonas sp. KK5]